MPIDTNMYINSCRRLAKDNPKLAKKLVEEMDSKSAMRSGFSLMLIFIVILMMVLF